MGIALVADIPDELVIRRIEDRMDRHGQFDHAQARAKVAAGHCDDIDDFLADFVSDLLDLGARTALQVRRGIDGIEQPVGANFCHLALSFLDVSAAVSTWPIQYIVHGMEQDSGLVTENSQMFLGLGRQ